MEKKEELILMFNEDYSLRINLHDGSTWLYYKQTGYGCNDVSEGLRRIQENVGHTNVRQVKTKTYTETEWQK